MTKIFIKFSGSNRSRVLEVLGARLALAVLLGAICVCGARAAGPAVAGVTLSLDDRTSPAACQGVHIASTGPRWVAVGWTIASGPREGVYLRQRHDQLWDAAALRLGGIGAAGNVGREPRDLDLEIDTLGRLHVVWTALGGTGRVVMHAMLSERGALLEMGPIVTAVAVANGSRVDADFPNLGAGADGSVVAVWQENENLSFGVRAARIGADGKITDLGKVSGAATAGMAPQLLTLDPLCVAWYEIGEQGSELRTEEWQASENRWRPSAMERLVREFPAESQVLLHASPQGLAATWQNLSAGPGGIKVGWLPAAAVNDAQIGPSVESIDAPGGELGRPTLAGALPQGLTLAWQVFGEAGQEIELGRSLGDGKPLLRVGIPAQGHQRCAALPDHVTLGAWSAVVWTDDARDGGDGGVYFNEVNWPTGS